MQKKSTAYFSVYLISTIVFFNAGFTSIASEHDKNQNSQPVPIRTARVEIKMVSDQISLVGTAEAIAKSTIASEVSGIVEYFPVKEGDYIKKGDLLVKLRSTDLKLILKGAVAAREKSVANLENAKKELARVSSLKDVNSIAERKYDETLYNYRALSQELVQNNARIEQLEYEISQKEVLSPFSGFIAVEHTQVGQWVSAGGAVVTLIDLSKIRITVDVPERHAVLLSEKGKVMVNVKSIPGKPLSGKIYAILPQGNSESRTFPVRINISNPGFEIKSGMEVLVTFDLARTRNALLVPKDSIVTSGEDKMIFSVLNGKAVFVRVKVTGYFDGNVAVEGNLKPGDLVVIRGNERLRPGQAVSVQE
jgi:RND family efflux transporter MFP subunit